MRRRLVGWPRERDRGWRSSAATERISAASQERGEEAATHISVKGSKGGDDGLGEKHVKRSDEHLFQPGLCRVRFNLSGMSRIPLWIASLLPELLCPLLEQDACPRLGNSGDEEEEQEASDDPADTKYPSPTSIDVKVSSKDRRDARSRLGSKCERIDTPSLFLRVPHVRNHADAVEGRCCKDSCKESGDDEACYVLRKRAGDLHEAQACQAENVDRPPPVILRERGSKHGSGTEAVQVKCSRQTRDGERGGEFVGDGLC